MSAESKLLQYKVYVIFKVQTVLFLCLYSCKYIENSFQKLSGGIGDWFNDGLIILLFRGLFYSVLSI